MYTSGQQALQKVGQNSQAGPGRHSCVNEDMEKPHHLGSGRWQSQSESGPAHGQKEHVGAENHSCA